MIDVTISPENVQVEMWVGHGHFISNLLLADVFSLGIERDESSKEFRCFQDVSPFRKTKQKNLTESNSDFALKFGGVLLKNSCKSRNCFVVTL